MKRNIYTTLLLLVGFTGFSPAANAQSRLLPFQGRLSAADGSPLEDSVRVVQFKIYDSPVAGRAVWNGELHKLSVNAGLVNTILGTKQSFPENYGVNDSIPMFSAILYLEITVDANHDGSITPSDPPLLPRQVLLPANFAHRAGRASDSEKVEGITLFQEIQIPGGGRTKRLNPALFGEGSIPAKTISPGIEAGQIGTGAVNVSHLASEVLDLLTPVGSIMAYWGTEDPAGWMICDGRTLPESPVFDRLRKLVGDIAPDLRGQFLRGLDSSGTVDPDTNRVIGHKQEQSLQGHTHTLKLRATHNDNGDGQGYQLINTASNDAPDQNFTTTENSGNPKETRPVNTAVNFIIKY